MKKFLIKVNGNQYEVEVEEVRDGSVVEAAPVRAAAPKAAAKPAASGPVGATKVNAPMPGTILKVNVNPGDEVKKNQVLVVLEAMKMENEIVSPADGKVSSVNVAKGATVNAGDLLVSLS